MTMNNRIVLAARPVGRPQENDFRIETVPVPVIAAGEMLLRTRFLSLDPYMRGRMSDEASYAPPIGLGDVIVGRTVSEVIKSRLDGFSIGDTVLAENGWQQFAVSDGSRIRKLDPNLTHPSLILGVLGNSGFAADIGLHEVAKVASTDTVCVAAAAGPVGSTVVQLARKAGARVVAIAGGPDKVAYARDVLKADVALDHRDPGFAEALKTAAPGGIDVYFENVGGAILLAVLPLLNPRARIAICGLIAWYNLEAPPAGPDQAPFVLRTILRRRIRAEGFVLTDWEERRPAFEAVMAEWIADKSVVWKEDVVDGIENAPSAFIGMLEGHSFGKTVVRLDLKDWNGEAPAADQRETT